MIQFQPVIVIYNYSLYKGFNILETKVQFNTMESYINEENTLQLLHFQFIPSVEEECSG